MDYSTDDQGSDYGTDNTGDDSDAGFDDTDDYGFDDSDSNNDSDGTYDSDGSDNSDDSGDTWGDDSDVASDTDTQDYGTDYDSNAGDYGSQSDMALNGSGPVTPKNSNRQKQIDNQLDPYLKPQVDAWKHGGKSEPIQWPVPDPEHDPIFGPHAGMDQ